MRPQGMGTLAEPGLDGAGGSRIGPYSIGGVLGHGGMGIVYRGRHLETGKLAAIKTLSSVRETLLTGMRREIRALRRLDHPGVVAIRDDGVEHGVPWYAMDLLVGRTLRDHFHPHAALPTEATLLRELPSPASTATASAVASQGPARAPAPNAIGGRAGWRRVREAGTGALPQPQLLAIVQRVCEALSHVHACGIVHRDLKPDNIFVLADGAPVLVDLGIATPFAGERGRERLEHVAELAGTVAYMAPEQISGELVDARADLYAVGCILYECVTGEPPFYGVAASAILSAHLYDRPVPPCEVADHVPRELERLILRLLEKRPEDRVGYADDVAGALATFVPVDGVVRPRAPRGQSYLYRPPFVGRVAAFAELKDAVVNIDRRGGIIYVSGESGVGKTRLVLETVRSAPKRFSIALAQCGTSGAAAGNGREAALAAFAPALLNIADHCRIEGAETSARLLGGAAKILAPYQPAFVQIPGYDALPEPLPLEPVDARARVLNTLADALIAFARVRPILIVIDDLQWADELSRNFLRLLQERGLDRHALLVVATYRSDEMAGQPVGVEATGGTAVAQIELRRFEASDVGALLKGMLALAEVPPHLVELLHRQCGGNPFFLIEYLRAAIAEGILKRNDLGRWALGAPDEEVGTLGAAIPLPDSLAEILRLRLRSLQGGERHILQAAAILGREFDADLLFACATLDGPDAIDALEALTRRQVIEDAGPGRLRFTHDGLRSVAQHGISGPDAVELHRKAAVVLDSRHRDQPSFGGTCAAIAHHWASAAEHDHASHHFAIAARYARTRYAHSDAIGLFQSALDEKARSDSGQPEAAESGWLAAIHEELGEVLALSGRQTEAAAAFRDALARAAGATNRSRLFRKVGKTHEVHHHHDEALRAYADAEQALGDEPSLPAGDDGRTWWMEWTNVQIDRVMVHYWLAQQEPMERILERLRRVPVNVGAAPQRAQLFKSLVYLNMRRERYDLSDQTVEYAAHRLTASNEWANDGEILEARFMHGIALLFRGRVDEAAQALADALPEVEQRGDRTLHARFLTYLTVARRRRGEIEATNSAATECIAVARLTGMTEYIGTGRANLGWVAWRRGSNDEARRECEAAVKEWSGLPLVYPLQWLARLVLFALDVEAGASESAREQATTILDSKQQILPSALSAALADGRAGHHRAVELANRFGYL